MLFEDINALEKRKIGFTKKEALINARVGQGKFRSQVLLLWKNKCCVTGSTTIDAIRASHIKPWRDSTDEERLDPHNGLPLIANLDALFDAGLISFESSGKLIVSSSLSERERSIFQIELRSLRNMPSEFTEEYLVYHRKRVFRK
jgi:putative restriction endonuclease